MQEKNIKGEKSHKQHILSSRDMHCGKSDDKHFYIQAHSKHVHHKIQRFPPPVLFLTSSAFFYLPSAIKFIFHIHLWGVKAQFITN